LDAVSQPDVARKITEPGFLNQSSFSMDIFSKDIPYLFA